MLELKTQKQSYLRWDKTLTAAIMLNRNRWHAEWISAPLKCLDGVFTRTHLLSRRHTAVVLNVGHLLSPFLPWNWGNDQLWEGGQGRVKCLDLLMLQMQSRDRGFDLLLIFKSVSAGLINDQAAVKRLVQTDCCYFIRYESFIWCNPIEKIISTK